MGYQDPNFGELTTSSPTMSRRSRQLAYQQAIIGGWTKKADVRSAFLQTAPTQRARNIYARPVPELARALHIGENEAVQVAKAAYGLVNAPLEWYRDVNKTLTRLGMVQLKSDPCCWKLVKWAKGRPQLLGLICCHVDDIVLAGNENVLLPA